MNEFTKDEIECLDANISGCYVPYEIRKQLEAKLENMVENYCDHDYVLMRSFEGGNVIQCEKCGKGFTVGSIK